MANVDNQIGVGSAEPSVTTTLTASCLTMSPKTIKTFSLVNRGRTCCAKGGVRSVNTNKKATWLENNPHAYTRSCLKLITTTK